MGTGFSKKKKEARAMQEQFSMIQNQMSSMEVTGAAGSGLVTITLSGDGEMKSIKIKPECVDPEDVEGLEILIKAAHQDAKEKLKSKTPTGLPGLFG
jgi:hypothetical protein